MLTRSSVLLKLKDVLVTGRSSESLFSTMSDTIAALKHWADTLEEENHRLRAKLTKTL